MDKVRSEFEAWAKRQLWDTEWGEIEYGACGYLSDLTQGAWLLWQDKAALSSREGEAVAWMEVGGRGRLGEPLESRVHVGRDRPGMMPTAIPLYAAPSARVAELERLLANEADWKAAYKRRAVELERDMVLAHEATRLMADGLNDRIASLEAQLAEIAALLPGPYYMDPPDGGDVSIAEQVRRMAADVAASREREGRMREALEEFGMHSDFCQWLDNDVCDCGLDAALAADKEQTK